MKVTLDVDFKKYFKNFIQDISEVSSKVEKDILMCKNGTHKNRDPKGLELRTVSREQ